MEIAIPILLAAAGILLLILLFKILSKPLRWAVKLLLNAIVGFVALTLLNALGGLIGVSLGVNWLNAIVVGVLGVPGVILLLLIKYFL